MSKTGTERFDELFSRIVGEADEDESSIPATRAGDKRTSPSKSTPNVGKLFFRVYESETVSEETGKPLYPPSITVFGVRSAHHLHVKRHEVEEESGVSTERRKKAVKTLKRMEKLFGQYERIVKT